MLFIKIPEPNQALLISGSKTGEKGFKIITGKRAFVIPGLQKARFLNLDLHETTIEVTCVTGQGIAVKAIAVVAYKVGDDDASIANAARRFLGQQQLMDSQVHNIFTGHLRAIIGGMTIEDLIGSREKLGQETRDASADEMQALGLRLDTLKIQELDDPTNYIKNLAAPHLAEAERNARIAQANNDQQAAQAEAQAQSLVAEAERDTQIKQAGFQAEVQKAQAESAQAGPLAQAASQKAVVQEQTAVAELKAQQVDRELDATVRKPADAANYQQIKLAEANKQTAILNAEANAQQVNLAAEAEAKRVTLLAGAQATQTQQVGEAEGAAIRARGEAEGAALEAKAKGLAANQEAVIGQQLAGQAVDIVKAAAGIFDHVDSVTVLNGASGLMETLSTVISQSLGTFQAVKEAVGHQEAPANGAGQIEARTTRQPVGPR